MERRDFLESIGLGAAFVLTASCLHSCTSSAASTGSVDFTLDLTTSANATLKTKGNYIVTNGVVVALDNNGNYVAATQVCSHANNPNIYFDGPSSQFRCTVHGAHFSETGAGLNDNASKGLTIYKTALSGNSLRVYG
jgi:cytochrome b6-f complex iron-sulfur subunit